MTGTQVEAVQVVTDPAEQLLDQRGAARRQFGRQRIALGLQGPQDIQGRRRGVQADAIADATVAGRVVGEDQRHTLLGIGQARQDGPASGQFGDKIHALGRGPVADHIALAALAAPGQVLETDGAADDPSVQFRQGNVHRQVPRSQALLAGPPAGFVVLGADRLDHRDVAAKRSQIAELRG